MKLCQITVNDPIIVVLYQNEFFETYILSNGHETRQSYNDQIIMKQMYMCILMVLNFRLNIYLHVISTNFETV